MSAFFSEFTGSVQFIIAALNFLFVIIVLAAQRKFVTRPEYEEFAATANEKSARLDRLEVDIEHMQDKLDDLPDNKEFHDLLIQLKGFEGEFKVVMERFSHLDTLSQRMQTQVDRMEEFLKSGKK